ncbi:coiled-coil domain-containing protein 112-like isoform X1 [Bicyclus anynana]|uniref:Coiled-coil domain-containing protein 112-like isoform X1 n=1 Tax=Bicyclus anynana TaxID=110368 RepID=A0A6J1MNC3_BICAN|nr:coiled-coil domain-containing protein 112-like isoform X1 [Bicyclus anynana]
MSSLSSNSVSSRGSISDNNFSSQLRRLKIQESVLSANVNKCFLLNSEENDGFKKNNNNTLMKKYISNLKDNFQEVKNLFEEIALQTNDQQTFENTDIDELKRNILELETKIRNMKQFINNELEVLKNEEITLMEKPETSHTSINEGRKSMKHNVTQRKGYNEIVPSPVRVIINSPFKCLEVQQFQDFMKKSPNRYGGWNEYNHNIFVQIWNKYYGENIMIAVKSIEDSFSYQDFKEEVLQKVSGTSLDCIDSHSKWYSEYLNLKVNQQKALNKWRENKRKIRPTRKVPSIQIESPNNRKIQSSPNYGSALDRSVGNERNQTQSDTFIESRVDEDDIYRYQKYNSLNALTKTGNESTSGKGQSVIKKPKITKLDITRLLKPTKQMLITQKSEKGTYELNKCVENIAKLRTPLWRLNLREY